jgi:hypothetical protein
MKYIPLTKGKVSIVDDEDFRWLSQWKWQYLQNKNGYAIRDLGRKYLHREIMHCPKGKQVDHINHNTLDNRKENLRICTGAENHHNIIRKSLPESGYRGVKNFNKQRKKLWIAKKGNRPWSASIMVNRKYIYLGCYFTKEEAAKVYNEAAVKYFGEYAHLNIIKNDIMYP